MNRFIKTIYGKLFNMTLEFDGMSPFRRAHRVQSVQRLEARPPFRQPSLCCLILHNLSIFLPLDREIKNTSQGQHCLQPREQSQVPSRTFCLGLISCRSCGSSWPRKTFCLMVIVMWYSAFYNGSRVVSGCNIWGKGTAVCARHWNQVGILSSGV